MKYVYNNTENTLALPFGVKVQPRQKKAVEDKVLETPGVMNFIKNGVLKEISKEAFLKEEAKKEEAKKEAVKKEAVKKEETPVKTAPAKATPKKSIPKKSSGK